MLSAVPGSRRAVEMTILIVRAFVKLREMVASYRELGKPWSRATGSRVGDQYSG